ncbi:unnamed protein product [Dracunculus medinensis]|uniref:Peptidase_M23 domain-containing protein n=1 Tax=Dracunculus medinensis TaxID=318479 RepID=A0A0N4U398_DRAME|nr:unnamed protein product [Dracunculus medinensis]
MPNICKNNDGNKLIECDGNFCGAFKSQRQDGQLLEGIDIRCDPNSEIFAPFDGEMYFWRPYGNTEGYKCADEGVRIEGTGQWQGYHILISSIIPNTFGGKVMKGERIGRANDHRCIHGGTGEPYIRFQLFNEGRPVDPTYHLQECMCTGQICESNPKNDLLGPPFKHDSRFNGVRGWDIKCPLVIDDDEEQPRAPDIYSPIDAEVIGRSRLYSKQGAYIGCDNNGVVLIGTGAWKDFEVVLYNVHYRDQLLGRQRVIQGQPIGIRLNCGDSPDSVFMEVRYRGVIVDISDMISANKCKMPEFSPK